MAAPAIANRRLQPQQPVDAVSARVLAVRRGARCKPLVARYARASLHRVKLRKPVQELVQRLQVVAAAIRITKLQPKPNPARRNVRQAKRGKQAPGVPFAAPLRHVIAKRHAPDADKFVLGHAGPVKREVGIRNFKRSRRQAVKKKAGHNPEVSPAPAQAGSKKIRIMMPVNLPELHVPFVIDGEDLHGRDPVDRQTMQSREYAVAAPGDVAAGPHVVAAPSGNGHPPALVQVNVGFAELLSRADAVTVSIAWQGIAFQQAQIQERSPRDYSPQNPHSSGRRCARWGACPR